MSGTSESDPGPPESDLGPSASNLGPSKDMAEALLDVAGGSVSAILLFGSRLAGTRPDPHSAHDLVVLTDDDRRFYEALAGAGHHRRSPRVLALLARVLPPNIVAFFPSGRDGPVAKCMILSREGFHDALAPGAPDHFVKGRMVQRVAVLHARDEDVRRRVEEDLSMARRDVLRWAGPFVESPFRAEDLARRMLEVSYGGEIRPEAADRVNEVFEAQRDVLVPTFRGVLEEAAAEGRVERVGEAWRLSPPPTRRNRWSLRVYFLRSKVRSTLRWFKHVVTFDDWLTYIRRKVERRTGMEVEITELERKYPLVLLWPKVFRVLAARPTENPAADGEPGERRAGDGEAG